MAGYHLTLTDILKRKNFNNAKVLAGTDGLERSIKWVHILETKDFDSLLNGGELILTTGINLELETSLDTYERLIEKEAAGICIEVGPYFKKLPPEIKEFADKHRFPIIIFEKVVKFVDITQDIHTHMINQHYHILSRLNELTKQLTELSLSPNGVLKILTRLHEHFQKNALFISHEVKSFYYPPEAKDDQLAMFSYIEELESKSFHEKTIRVENKTYALTPVRVLGQVWGYLSLQVGGETHDEYVFHVLDRASLAIAQILLRNKTREERKLSIEDDLVQNLLLGKPYNAEELKLILPESNTEVCYYVLTCQTNIPAGTAEEEWDETKIQRSMMVRSIFKRFGFFPAVSVKKSEITVICFIHSEQKGENTKQRLEMLNAEFANIIGNGLSISKSHKDIANTAKAYQEAKEVLRFNQIYEDGEMFYEKIGLYRLLFQIKDKQLLGTYIEDYIGPIIRYDRKMNSQLLKTLELYLKFNESKKETAGRLFIVRQTLYHRLEKIEDLLGEDYLQPTNRLAIEAAIKSYRLTVHTSV